MTIEHSHTDLFDVPSVLGQQRHLAHGVNTHGVMGAGVAKQFARRYPQLLPAYRAYINHYTRHDIQLPGDWFRFETGTDVIHNLFSQDAPGPTAQLEWLELSLSHAMNSCWPGVTIHLPWIGAGIGGLTRQEVARTFLSVASDYPDVHLHVHTHPAEEIDERAVDILFG